jgi:tripartite-type tricarboxylate transporter receptor subunit TctC
MKRLLTAAKYLLAAIALAGTAAAAAAQQYPSQPIRLVVPYPPGGLTDLLGRTIGDRLSAALKEPVVIENKPGAGTLVGAEYVAKSAPDGYTLLLATSTTLGISPAIYKNSPIDPIRDFAPIYEMGTVNFFLIGNPSFPAKNVRELIDTIKANPGKFNYASVGNGSAHHLFMEILKKEYGLDIQHIPYRGTLMAMADLLSGKVQIMFCDATAALPYIRAGKVIAYGTSAAKQTGLIPTVPPIAKTVPGFDWQAWQGVVAPAATPPEIVGKLGAELQRIASAPKFREVLIKFGMDPAPPNTPAEFAEMVKSDVGRWAKAVAAAKARVD